MMTRIRPELEAFARELRTIMAERAVTATDLAATLGVSRGAVSNWRSGTAAPELAHVVALCKELGVPAERLMSALAGEPIGGTPLPDQSPRVREVARHLDDLSPATWDAIRMLIEADEARQRAEG